MATEKLWTKDFILGTGINFCIMTNYYALMVVIADYAMKTYGSPASVAGLAASIFIIGALFSRFITGGIMDRVGRKRLLLITSVAEVVFSCLYLAGIGLGLMFVLRTLHGFCYGSGSTTVGTIVTSIVPNSRKGEGVGYYMLSVTLGAAIGPFLGMFLTQVADYNTLFIAAIVIAVLDFLFVLQLKTPEQAPHLESAAAAREIAEELHEERRAAGHKVDAPAKAATEHHGFRFTDFFELSVVPISATCTVLFFCYSSLLTFLTPFSEENGLQAASSMFFVVYAVATFVTRPFTGKLFDQKGDRAVMVPSFIAFVVGMAILGNVHHPAVMLIAAALMGFGVGTIQSSALALCVRIAPDRRISLANSTFYMFLDAGVGVGPLVLGIVEPFLGYRGLFDAIAVVSVVAAVMYLFVSRKDGAMRRALASNED